MGLSIKDGFGLFPQLVQIIVSERMDQSGNTLFSLGIVTTMYSYWNKLTGFTVLKNLNVAQHTTGLTVDGIHLVSNIFTVGRDMKILCSVESNSAVMEFGENNELVNISMEFP